MGKDNKRTLQIISAAKELMWVVNDIVTKTIKTIER